MKKKLLLSLVIFLLAAGTVGATVPVYINIQGKLTKTDGPIPDKIKQIVFQFYDVPTGGTKLGLDHPTDVDGNPPNSYDNTTGIFNARIKISLNDPDLAFDKPYYLAITIKPVSGSDIVLTDRQPLYTVPYAYRAAVADKLSSGIKMTGPLTVETMPGTYLLIGNGTAELGTTWNSLVSIGISGKGGIGGYFESPYENHGIYVAEGGLTCLGDSKFVGTLEVFAHGSPPTFKKDFEEYTRGKITLDQLKSKYPEWAAKFPNDGAGTQGETWTGLPKPGWADSLQTSVNETVANQTATIADMAKKVADLQLKEGPPGPIGPIGPVGQIGQIGPQGLAGAIGPQGLQGLAGAAGLQGLEGPEGPAGAIGPQGVQGVSVTAMGYNGTNGFTYTLGNGSPQTISGTKFSLSGGNLLLGSTSLGSVVGPQGPAGAIGPQGLQGLAGAAGLQGLEGPEGPAGPQGLQGIQGAAGKYIKGALKSGSNMILTYNDDSTQTVAAANLTGFIGAQGLQGLQGLQGAQGLQGLAGAAGAAGKYIKAVTGTGANRTITYSDNSTATVAAADLAGLVGAQGLQGLQGLQGAQGLQGLAGAVGTMGPAGAIGPQGLQGLAGAVGAMGPAGASVTGLQLSGGNLQYKIGAGTWANAGLFQLDSATGVLTVGSTTFNTKGATGLAGAVGATGAQGPQGPQGTAAIANNWKDLLPAGRQGANLPASLTGYVNGDLFFKTNTDVGGKAGIYQFTEGRSLHLVADDYDTDWANIKNRPADLVRSSDTSLFENGNFKSSKIVMSNSQLLSNYLDYTTDSNGSLFTCHKLIVDGIRNYGANPTWAYLTVRAPAAQEVALELMKDSTPKWTVAVPSNSDDLQIRTGDFTPRLAVKSTGNVGIGETNPSVKLQVNVENPFSGTTIGSSVLTNGSVDIVSTTAQGQDVGPILALGGNRGTSNGVFGGIRGAKENSTNDNTAGYLGFYTLQSGVAFAERMRITSGGNVGIGTTTPGAYKLYVAGNAYTTGTWGTSDERLKKNIVPLDNVMPKLLGLSAVNFDWRREEYPDKGLSEGRQIGLIAQDVEKEFPELVRTDNDGYKAVNYDQMTAVLLEAIKEQQATITSLEARLNALEAKVDNDK